MDIASLGQVGIWTFRTERLTPDEIRVAAAHVESLGFACMWVPEVGGTEAMTLAMTMLDSTESLIVANGIARISDRSAAATAAAHRFLRTAYGDRHLLGLGLGGALANGPKPLDLMAGYLDAFDEAFTAREGEDGRRPDLVLAAYAPKLSKMAGVRTMGVHTYLITPTHTMQTRQQIGQGALLAAEQAIVLSTDEEHARQVARDHMASYLGSPAHQRKFRRLGFGDDELANGGSDRLVDAVVAWGTDDQIRQRINAQHLAGANHVGIQVLGTSTLDEDLKSWSRVAALTADLRP